MARTSPRSIFLAPAWAPRHRLVVEVKRFVGSRRVYCCQLLTACGRTAEHLQRRLCLRGASHLCHCWLVASALACPRAALSAHAEPACAAFDEAMWASSIEPGCAGPVFKSAAAKAASASRVLAFAARFSQWISCPPLAYRVRIVRASRKGRPDRGRVAEAMR